MKLITTFDTFEQQIHKAKDIVSHFKYQMLNFQTKHPLEYLELHSKYIEDEIWHNDNFSIRFKINNQDCTSFSIPK